MMRIRHVPHKRFARGDHAWGQCRKCGFRSFLNDLVEDPDTGLLVHAECADPVHPQERVDPIIDPVALERPAPDLDGQNSYTANTSLEDDDAFVFPHPFAG